MVEHLNLLTNYKWLPIKVHYFLLFGTAAGVWPFLPVIGKDIGLSATAVGITFSIQPIFIFIFKPVFGYLADSLQNIKAIIICLMTGTVVLATVITLIEPLQKSSYYVLEIYQQILNKTEIYKTISSDFYESCVNLLFNLDKINCDFSYQNSSFASNITERSLQIEAGFSCVYDTTHKHTALKNNEYLLNSTSLRCFILLRDNLSESREINETGFSLTECDNIVETCLASNTKSNFYVTYQFWAYTFLLIAAGTFYTTAMSLSDVACYEILGEQKEYYGKQRLWGTVSTGVVTLLAGYLNDLIGRDEDKTEYLAGYYIMASFFLLNMVLLANINLPKTHLSKTIISDIKTLFKSLDFVVYSIAVFFIGIFSGLIANYLFWYLKELGASQTLLGLVITFQCLLTEVPFFFFAGWFIKHLGYFNCLVCSFAAFSLRFGLYSLLQNPWMTLPIEILHGVTYAVFYASRTAFASVHAPPGTEGTLLGLLGGLCDGLGYAAGSFLGGLGFDRIGGGRTFLTACILSLILVPVTLIAHFVFKKRHMDVTIK